MNVAGTDRSDRSWDIKQMQAELNATQLKLNALRRAIQKSKRDLESVTKDLKDITNRFSTLSGPQKESLRASLPLLIGILNKMQKTSDDYSKKLFTSFVQEEGGA